MKVGGIGVGCRVIEVIYQYFARGDCGYHTASCARWRSCGGEGKEYLFLMWQTDGFCFEQDETHIALSLLSLAVKYGVPLLEWKKVLVDFLVEPQPQGVTAAAS